MISKATAYHIRISPRKVRQVIDLIRGRNCVEALSRLNHLSKRAALHVRKILNSALRSAELQSGYVPEQLFVSKVTADKGPSMKRFRARAMGRAAPILKRMSHIHMELDLVPGATLPKEEEKPTGKLAAIGRRMRKKTAASAQA